MNITALPPMLWPMLTPPKAGEGVHKWLFHAARRFHAHLPAAEIVTLLANRVQGCGRHVSRREIEDAVKNSAPLAWKPRGHAAPMRATPKWPKTNQALRAAIIRDGGGLAALRELSPVRLAGDEPHTEEIIDRLFPGNPLLCCGRSEYLFDTRLRAQWRGQLSKLQFIVPSPMSARIGLTKGGKASKHSLANTGPLRFLVCEFDTGTTDDQAAFLLHLATLAPMVCAVQSGGKSLHGWFFQSGQAEARVERFFRYAVSLGADRATWTRSQFVRMPGGTRRNGNRQTVIYLNFNPLETDGKSHSHG